MNLDRYYYITSLPALGELGSVPPIKFRELREYLADTPQRQELVSCLFLSDDLLQRQAFLAGELEEVSPAVLSEKQTRGRTPLPEFLLPPIHNIRHDSPETARNASPHQALTNDHITVDETWNAYFHHAVRTAQRYRCSFLSTWVRHEVTLRNALVSLRAKRLELDEANYLIATDLAEVDDLLEQRLSDWETADTPLAGHQALIRVRWDWLAEHDRYFTFQDDELAAYALRLMLLKQWCRTMGD